MRPWGRCISALVCAAFALGGVAQADERLSPTLRFKRVAKPPKGNINDFTQDAAGFIWIASNEGLGRFDGYQFRYFAPDGKPGSLSDETVLSLYPDGKGSLWVGTSKGLERLDLATFQFEQFKHDERDPASLGGSTVSRVAGATGGKLWIGTDAGFSLLDPATKKFKNYRIDGADGKPLMVRSLLEDKQGTLWLGTDGGLARLDAKADRVVRLDPEADMVVGSLLEDPSGQFWVGTTNGLYQFDRKAQLTRAWPDKLRIVTTLVNGPGGMLIVGSREDGLFFADTNRKQLANHRANPNRDDAILNPNVSATFVDRGGVLWAGFYAGGVVKADLAVSGIRYYATKPGLSFLENPDGTVWIGHEGSQEGSGLRLFDPKTGASKFFLQKEREGTWITSIVRDDEDWLWLGTTELGVFRWNPKTGEVRHFTSSAEGPDRISADGVFPLYFEKRTRKLWIGTLGGGIDIFDLASGTFQHYRADANGLGSDVVFALHHDRTDPDVMWIGTNNGGLSRLQMSTGTFTTYRASSTGPKLSHDSVTSIHESADGTLWIGTYGGGLNRFDRGAKSIQAYGVNEGLPSNVIYGVMEDKTGSLWLTTNAGLVKFDPKAGTTFTFTEADGLGQDEFAQAAYYKGPSGTMYVGGPRGFNTIDPDKLKPSTYAGPIHLTGLRIYGERQPLDSEMSFSYNDDVITFDFASLNFADPERIKYRYRLPPLYTKWIEATGPSITLTSLPHDKYRLEIQATNHHGLASSDQLEIEFRIAPPPWRTWWAYAIYMMLLVLFILAIVRFQRSRIQALQAQNRLDAVERDLELTGAVQSGFLPEQSEIATPRLQVFGYYRPADACGGDWWWHEELADGRHILMVGDVTGHGAGAAMVTAAVATAFRVLIENGLNDLDTGLALLNREVLRVGRGKYHMTMAAVEFDENTGRWMLYNAGAPPIMSLNQAGAHRVHFCPGAPLGTEQGFEVGKAEGVLQPTERLLIYTDGIPEIILPTGTQLGMRRFARLYERTRTQHLRDAAATIVMHADQSRSDQPQLDDWTFALIEWGAQVYGGDTMPYPPGKN